MLIDIKQIKEKLTLETLDNGLDVYIYDNEELVEYSANYVTFFGSNDLELELDGEVVALPHGIAHFLEHVMFAMEDGDAFTKFSENLASPNAFTSYNQTSYIFSCFTNFEENLKNLIHMVQTPYFRDDLVDKEVGIILEEMRMYAQMPEWNIRNYTFDGVCNQTNYKIDIVGDEPSIRSINKEYLLKIFNYFYVPSNQALIIGGNFKGMDIKTFINDCQLIKDNTPAPAVVKKVEDIEVKVPAKHYTDDKITNMLSTYTYKFPVALNKFENITDYFILSCYANAYFTENNREFNDALESKQINNSFGFNIHVTNDIKLLIFDMSIDSAQNELVKFVDRELKITKEEFANAYKYCIASEVRAINNRRNLVDQISYLLSDELQINEYYDALFNLDIDAAYLRCEELINGANKFYCSISQ